MQLHDWAHTFTALAGAGKLPHPDGADLTGLLTTGGRQVEDWRSHILNVYYGCELLYTQRIAIGDLPDQRRNSLAGSRNIGHPRGRR